MYDEELGNMLVHFKRQKVGTNFVYPGNSATEALQIKINQSFCGLFNNEEFMEKDHII